MRLLHTTTRLLSEFHGKYNTPRYAILSHTWEAQEVSLQDLSNPDHWQKAGYSKIDKCCSQAASDGWDYVWIDTCCIDKTSSAELSEAINSMYRWYENAEVCYVYLSDYCLEQQDARLRSNYCTGASDQKMSPTWAKSPRLGRSRWFWRGWTLQELIAPLDVIFYDRCWMEIGTKRSLRHEISLITGIQPNYLTNPEGASIAAKMSWASRRQTTREEDLAYCLLGLFHVNMPLLYGEGSAAFIRLQHEIIKISSDESIFAWEWDDPTEFHCQWGIFAESPDAFSTSGDIVSVEGKELQRQPYVATNKGLAIDLLVMAEDLQMDSVLLHLNCAREGSKHKLIAIKLNKWTHGGQNVFLRESVSYQPNHLLTYEANDLLVRGLRLRKLYVRTHNKSRIQMVMHDPPKFSIRPSPSFQENFTFIRGYEHWCNFGNPVSWKRDFLYNQESHHLSADDIAALLFEKNDSFEYFTLLLIAKHKSLNIDIRVHPINSSVEDITKGLSQYRELKESSQESSDQLLRKLQCNTKLSVKLKKAGCSGKVHYYVDLDIA